MNRWLPFAAYLLAASAQDWTALYNGKNLNGWTQCNGQARYQALGSEIRGTTVEGSPNSFLCSDKPYGDFVLEFEVKTDPALNSGVQFRSHRYDRDVEVMTENQDRKLTKHAAGRVYGYQVEVATEKSGASGGIYDEARRGWIDNIQSHPAASKAFRDNQWNRYRVEAEGDNIRTFVNGVPCADLVDSMDLSGFIGLQVHSYKGDHPAQVGWRNLRIQDRGRHEWKPLWDGKSLKGWKQEGGGDWKIVDGALRGTQSGAGGSFGFLVSERELGDFTARMKYRIARGNSGVFFHRGQGEAGYEVEVDPTRDPGGLQEPGKRNWIVRTGPATDAWYYKPGDWNELTISAHRGRVVVRVNGIKTAGLTDDTGRRSGHLALQLNPRQELEVYFKDIELLEKAQ